MKDEMYVARRRIVIMYELLEGLKMDLDFDWHFKMKSDLKNTWARENIYQVFIKTCKY